MMWFLVVALLVAMILEQIRIIKLERRIGKLEDYVGDYKDIEKEIK